MLKILKDKSIQSDSIKRKERIKNIDVELEIDNLRSNSEKMTAELMSVKINCLLSLVKPKPTYCYF